jgi:sigma-B regulation protein RsbU (phosphoserine phosphatase)
VSGDFYGHLTSPNNEAWFCLGDVSGKGINAALWMVRALTMFSCLAQEQSSPARLLEALNRGLRLGALRGMFVTMVVGWIDESGCHARLANAGHLPVLIWRLGKIVEIPASGPPIGIIDDVVYEDVSAGPGPAIVCVASDGVVEAIAGRNFADLELLKRRVSAMMEAGRFSADALIADLSTEGEALNDDATVVTVELLAPLPGEEETGVASLLFSMRFDATSAQLKPMREALFPVLQAQGTEAELAHNLVLAVNEACMNIVQHCAPKNRGTEITLQLLRQGATLIFNVLDNAAPIDVMCIAPRDLSDVRPGGLGVHFMREIMDEVAFLPPPAGFGNLLRMKKRLPANSPPS